jgi:hypothetical protein
MIFIIGFGHEKIKDIGPLKERKWERCNNLKFWMLQKRQLWVTLFFLPIFPSYTEYRMSCTICGEFIRMSKEEFIEAEPMAIENQKLVNTFNN